MVEVVRVGDVGQLLGGEAAGDQLEEAAQLRGGRLVHLPALLHLDAGEMSGIVRQDWDLIGLVIEVSFSPAAARTGYTSYAAIKWISTSINLSPLELQTINRRSSRRRLLLGLLLVVSDCFPAFTLG